MSKYSFSLCEDCDQCPIVQVDGEKVRIADDYGGHVLLTKKEIGVLLKRMQ
jgi:hypothetical protein